MDAIRFADPSGSRFAETIRATYDQIYDGQHTGRYSVEQLMKTEKTHIGTLVEINLQREFKWDDGTLYDYTIEGVDIDCKFAQRFGSWMIPPELYDRGGLALVVWADDAKSLWSAGVARLTLEVLRDGENRDRKKSLRAESLESIFWIWRDEALPENTLLHLDPDIRRRVLEAEGSAQNKGAGRTRALFRLVQGRAINRATVVTVALQNDPMKRAREVREQKWLGREGIIVLGHWKEHADIAVGLGLPVPPSGSFVSARIVAAEAAWTGQSAEIGGSRYRLATEEDPVVPAPSVPWQPPKSDEDESSAS